MQLSYPSSGVQWSRLAFRKYENGLCLEVLNIRPCVEENTGIVMDVGNKELRTN